MYSNLRQLVEYRDLLRTLVSKDIRSRYKGSILGFAWNFAIPLLQLPGACRAEIGLFHMDHRWPGWQGGER